MASNNNKNERLSHPEKSTTKFKQQTANNSKF